MDIRNYLTQKGYIWKEVKRPTGLQAVLNCPFCGDTERKFAISLESGAFQCYHKNKCAATGSFWDFQKRLGDQPRALDNDNFFKKKPENKVYHKPKVQPQNLTLKELTWLHKRKIKDETIKKFKIGLTQENVIAFPYFNRGQLSGIKYRSITEKRFWKEKDTEPILYNIDMVDNFETLYITEGEIDCMSLYEYGITSVSLPSGVQDLNWIEYQWNWLQQFKNIYLILDQDEAGQSAVETIVNRLGKWRCYNVILPKKDVNDCLMSGISSGIFFECIVKAKEFNHEMLTNPKDIENDIIELFENKQKLYGIEIPFKKLNSILKGWRENEVTAWTGRNGSGKSTLLNQLFLDLAEKQQRCCIFSGELRIDNLLRWAIIQYKRNANPTNLEIKQTIGFLSNYWWLYNSTENINANDLLDAFEFAARKYNVKFFLIDSLLKIRLNYKYELNEQKEFINSLTRFVKKYKCHVHIITHPRKSENDSHVPDKVDVKGASEITDLVDNFITVWRPNEEVKAKEKAKGRISGDAVLYVKKNREWGTEGKVNLDFFENVKLFREC